MRLDGAGATLYHLHPELVDQDEGGPTALLCQHCYRVASSAPSGFETSASLPPKLSIAAGYDYGFLSRLGRLEELSEVETMLLSKQRLYHVVAKVASALAQRSSCAR